MEELSLKKELIIRRVKSLENAFRQLHKALRRAKLATKQDKIRVQLINAQRNLNNLKNNTDFNSNKVANAELSILAHGKIVFDKTGQMNTVQKKGQEIIFMNLCCYNCGNKISGQPYIKNNKCYCHLCRDRAGLIPQRYRGTRRNG